MTHKAILLFALSLSFLVTFPNCVFQVQVLGQDAQVPGLVRCSAGNLVKSQTECPSSDICPTPEPNQTVFCSPSVPTKSLTELRTKSNESDTLAISTSKPSYKFGEIVNITIRNTGTDPLTFPNSILGLKIENSVTHKKYPLFAAQVITVLDSGGVKSLKWNQQDSGQQVKEGNYTVSTSTGSVNASKTFAIVK